MFHIVGGYVEHTFGRALHRGVRTTHDKCRRRSPAESVRSSAAGLQRGSARMPAQAGSHAPVTRVSKRSSSATRRLAHAHVPSDTPALRAYRIRDGSLVHANAEPKLARWSSACPNAPCTRPAGPNSNDELSLRHPRPPTFQRFQSNLEHCRTRPNERSTASEWTTPLAGPVAAC
jgi:hypothetical protein